MNVTCTNTVNHTNGENARAGSETAVFPALTSDRYARPRRTPVRKSQNFPIFRIQAWCCAPLRSIRICGSGPKRSAIPPEHWPCDGSRPGVSGQYYVFCHNYPDLKGGLWNALTDTLALGSRRHASWELGTSLTSVRYLASPMAASAFQTPNHYISIHVCEYFSVAGRRPRFLEMVKINFDLAADELMKLGMKKDILDTIKACNAVLRVQFPLRRDDGSVEVSYCALCPKILSHSRLPAFRRNAALGPFWGGTRAVMRRTVRGRYHIERTIQ